MVSDQDYLNKGLPLWLLGRHWKTWRIRDLQKIISYYEIPTGSRHIKIQNFAQLSNVVQAHGLQRQHRDILLLHNITNFHAVTGVPLSPRFSEAPAPAETEESLLASPDSSLVATPSSDFARKRSSSATSNPADDSNEQNRGKTQARGVAAVELKCTICDDHLNPFKTPSRDITAACKHAINTCLGCVAESIRIQLEDRMWNQLGCPQCNERLQFEDVQRWAPQGVFTRYDKIAFEATIPADQEYRSCAWEECTNGGYCNPQAESFFTCSVCQRRTCLSCKTIYHEGLTCAENREHMEERAAEEKAQHEGRKAEEEKATADFLEKSSRTGKTKVCPNKKCGGIIEKKGGCDHMTCRKCYTEFCWVCLAFYGPIWIRGNAAHREDCIYHPRNLR